MDHEANLSVWKEWDCLSQLANRIPQQFQNGFFIAPLRLTCLDAFLNHLVLGTNVGLVYIAHLPSYNLMRLKCENVDYPIICLSTISSVDDMIASGSTNGIISIFQLPATIPCEDLQKGITQEILRTPSSPKRYTIALHTSSITCLKWSKNGTHLFSGDVNGNVGLIDVDYENFQCTGRFILKVSNPVVQLSFCHPFLAVSYEEKCILYNIKDEKNTIIGKKPRNPPGKYGCIFVPSQDNPGRNTVYCTRPCQKVWAANTDGIVLYSYIHKKSPNHSMIKRINSNPSISEESCGKNSFKFINHLKNNVLVMHSESSLTILDISNQKVLGYSEDFTKICDVTVFHDNIFILDNFKHLICFSKYEPDFGHYTSEKITRPFQENLNLSTISELTAKVFLPNKQFIDGITKLGETVACKISEIANPTIISGDKNSTFTIGSNFPENLSDSIPKQYLKKPYMNDSPPLDSNKVSNTDCTKAEKLIFRSNEFCDPLVVPPPYGKKKTKRKNRFNELDAQSEIASAGDIEESQQNCLTASAVQHLGAMNDFESSLHPALKSDDAESGTDTENHFTTDDDFKKNIEEKERVLADVLDLNCLKMDHEIDDKEKSHNALVNDCPLSRDFYSSNLLYNDQFMTNKDYCEDYSESKSNCSIKYSSYGPPSGSSRLNSFGIPSLFTNASDTFNQFDYESDNKEHMPSENLSCDWLKYYLPGLAKALGSSRDTIFFSDSLHLYFSMSSPQNVCVGWKKNKFEFDIRRFSPSVIEGEIFFHVKDYLYKIKKQNLFSAVEPKLILENSYCASVDHNILWILEKNRALVAKIIKNDECPFDEISITCPDFQLDDIISRSGVTWGLIQNGNIAYRIGVSASTPYGHSWGLMESHPYPIKCVHLSNYGLGWMIDSEWQIFFRILVEKNHPQGMDKEWWQMEQSDFMMVSDEFWMTSTEDHLWISDKGSNCAFIHSLSTLNGHRWHKVNENEYFSVCAEGMYNHYGNLLCSNSQGELSFITASESSPMLIPLPKMEKLLCVSSRPEAIWMLSENGKIFIRTGLSSTSSIGTEWFQLDLTEIDDIRLMHLSLGVEVVWAVDEIGMVYMRQGPLTPPNKRGLAPGWLQVDFKELKHGAVFSKVYVGNKFNLVWGIDTNKRIYVREAIFQELSTGTSWVLVHGILAQSMAISEDRVFALTPSGAVFERVGVSSTNYIGDSWKKIPIHSVQLISITVSVDNRLWGLDSKGHVWQHTCHTFVNGAPVEVASSVDGVGAEEEADWEVV